MVAIFVAHTSKPHVPGSFPRAGGAAGPLVFRFAVGTFGSWTELHAALQDLRARGVAAYGMDCLALHRVLALAAATIPSDMITPIELLAFPENHEPIACTSGPLADCLAGRLSLGAISLKDALSHWLIPRHAASFQSAVESGKILQWVRLTDADEERRACQSLLASSSSSVGVHDLTLLSGKAGGRQ
jgi:hypothetical protein